MRFGSHYKEIVFLVANEKKSGKKRRHMLCIRIDQKNEMRSSFEIR